MRWNTVLSSGHFEQILLPYVLASLNDNTHIVLPYALHSGHLSRRARGLFVVPTVIETEVQKQYGVERLGRVESIRERFYAFTVNRRLRHPAVVAMSEAA